MSLKARITDDVKTAMKAGDRGRLGVLRLVTAAIKQVEVDERREMDDESVLAVLNRMVKQRRDSITQYRQGRRDDLADVEQAEIDIITGYLPEQLSDAALQTLIEAAVDATGAEGIRDMGKVMAAVREKAAGRADMARAGALVKARLNP